MAKVSPVSIKYMIYASFKSAGPLEKPDVIGAVFGQTEGLLGADMEMRELQKDGKIGRIGPTEAEIKIVKIEDVRGSKREYILERAKKLMDGIDGGSFREMSESL